MSPITPFIWASVSLVVIAGTCRSPSDNTPTGAQASEHDDLTACRSLVNRHCAVDGRCAQRRFSGRAFGHGRRTAVLDNRASVGRTTDTDLVVTAPGAGIRGSVHHAASMGLIRAVLPDSQRRTLAELTEDLDLATGDARSKRSAFWAMLTLSAVIASAGVLSDSTATVIGAMIIAPLSTPIMGIALGIAKTQAGASWRSGRYVLGGAALVVLIGVIFALVIPGSFDLLGNSQIAGRTSPGLGDLVAAVATGFAGAIALARRDVAAVLPGVAIAISLVPPLAVVGVCLGQGAPGLALGALILFLSNLIALVLAGTLVYATLGAREPGRPTGGPRRRAYLTIGILLVVVGIPLVGNTVGTFLVSLYTERAQTAAQQWLGSASGGEVQSVDFQSDELHINVQVPGALPPTNTLMSTLNAELPGGVTVVVNSSLGASVTAGQTG
jgi:uncharacterized hydrophobic protein (TIGR00271 family)